MKSITTMLLGLCLICLTTGCFKTMSLNVANGMLAWDFSSTPATVYKVGSYGTDTDGNKVFDALHFEAGSNADPEDDPEEEAIVEDEEPVTEETP